jgi:macrolide transport system ATP-binding/permease protein
LGTRQDLRYASRTLRKQMLVTATIVVTLGLGIGVNTAMFSLVNAVILRNLPVRDPEQLFVVGSQAPIAVLFTVLATPANPPSVLPRWWTCPS